MKKLYMLILFVFLIGCARQSISTPQKTGVVYDDNVKPEKGQPPFPKLGEYWVIDNGCNFSQEVVQDADKVFEQLRVDHIAEVAVICQSGIKGSQQDLLWWVMGWGNWAKLGDQRDKRGLVWVIRPDVRPEDHRVATQNSDWIYQNTAIDYFPVLEEAAQYANANDFDGALDAIVRGTNEVLRRVIIPTQGP